MSEGKTLPLYVHPVDSKPFGLSYEEWTEKWWKWLLSIPKERSPSMDFTGANANENQTDPNVFFLCQTIEGEESTPHRSIRIPTSKDILVPIMNWVSVLHVNGETDEELIKCATERMDVIKELTMSINGVKLDMELRNFRVKSRVFDFILPEKNVFDLPSGFTRLVSDGYWLLFHPLDELKGISTFSTCSSGLTKIAVEYGLEKS